MFVFFFNDTATTEIYTLSLHDALPIYRGPAPRGARPSGPQEPARRPGPAHPPEVWRYFADRPGLSENLPAIGCGAAPWGDRKSTRLNSSHSQISYAVFCLKKKTQPTVRTRKLFRIRLRRNFRMNIITKPNASTAS